MRDRILSEGVSNQLKSSYRPLLLNEGESALHFNKDTV